MWGRGGIFKFLKKCRGISIFHLSRCIGSNHPNEVGDKNKNSNFRLVSGIFRQGEIERERGKERGKRKEEEFVNRRDRERVWTGSLLEGKSFDPLSVSGIRSHVKREKQNSSFGRRLLSKSLVFCHPSPSPSINPSALFLFIDSLFFQIVFFSRFFLLPNPFPLYFYACSHDFLIKTRALAV